MNFTGVCLITENINGMKKFYEQVIDSKIEGKDDYYYFMLGNSHISLYTKKAMAELAQSNIGELGSGKCILEIEVDDVDNRYDRLCQLDAKIIKPPTTQDWGVRSVWFSDPDGNIINFLCNVKK